MVETAIIVKTLGVNGGTERFVWGLCHWLRQYNLPVVVYCQRVERQPDGIRVVCLPSVGRGRIWKMLELDHYARQLTNRRVLSFVRAGNPTLYRSGGGSHLAWTKINGLQLADLVELWLERRVLKYAKKVIVNSDMARQQVIQDVNVSPSKVKVIRNPIDLKRFQPLPVEPLRGTPALCFVGNNFSRKGLDIAIQCLQFFPEAHLTVLGGDSPKGYKKLLQRLALVDRVHFVGVVSPERYLPGADVCLLPTRYDPAANVVGEALACGIPTITTTLDGSSEIVPERSLVIADRTDLQEWKSTIEWVMSEKKWVERCRTVAERYSGERIYEQFWHEVEHLEGYP